MSARALEFLGQVHGEFAFERLESFLSRLITGNSAIDTFFLNAIFFLVYTIAAPVSAVAISFACFNPRRLKSGSD